MRDQKAGRSILSAGKGMYCAFGRNRAGSGDGFFGWPAKTRDHGKSMGVFFLSFSCRRYGNKLGAGFADSKAHLVRS